MTHISIERKKEMKKGLTNLLAATVTDPRYKQYFEYIFNSLNIKEKDVQKALFAYNIGGKEFGNKFYSGLNAAAVLHIHGLAVGSYHAIREQCIKDMLRLSKAKNIVEVGFGYPSPHIVELSLKEKLFKYTAYDYSQSILDYAKKALEYHETNWQEQVTLGIYDMNSNTYVGDFDAYVYLDAIEHTKDPTAYLKQTVQNAPKDAQFIFAIPLGALAGGVLEDFHYIEWLTTEDSRQWLEECGLEIIHETHIETVTNIDYFAEYFPDGKFTDHMVLCKKK